jgi:general secretion pathway protein M
MKLSMFQDWLAQRSPREQTGIRAALLIVGVLLLWRMGVAPGLQVWSQSDSRQATLDRQLAEMQTLQQEAKRLGSQTQGGADAALQQLTMLAATLGPDTRVNPQTDQVSIEFKAASPQALADFITQARTQAQSRTVQAHWQFRQGQWQGQLVMSLPAKR